MDEVLREAIETLKDEREEEALDLQRDVLKRAKCRQVYQKDASMALRASSGDRVTPLLRATIIIAAAPISPKSS